MTAKSSQPSPSTPPQQPSVPSSPYNANSFFWAVCIGAAATLTAEGIRYIVRKATHSNAEQELELQRAILEQRKYETILQLCKDKPQHKRCEEFKQQFLEQQLALQQQRNAHAT